MTLLLDDEGFESGWADFDTASVLEDVVRASLVSEGFDDGIQLSVSFVDEEGIRAVNQSFRDIDAPTDVLSFPMLAFSLDEQGERRVLEESKDFDPDSGELMLGDIVLCIPKVLAQAEEYGHSIKREYAFLLAHSMLHLLGYDHIESEEREEMEARQREILQRLSIER
ncbi:MAG: rRNA maturation RNase YbeY [Lachnospiraceae bacterium]|nr:rRNA maturation RNase YbeY [Lachnospiraceae bacterium]